MTETSESYHYASEKLANAVFVAMSSPDTVRDRLLAAVVHHLSVLHEKDLPDGRVRADFKDMMERILAMAPAESRDGLYEAAFFHMADDDVRWILNHLHALAFGMAEFMGRSQQ